MTDLAPEDKPNHFDASEARQGSLESKTVGQQQPFRSQDTQVSVINLKRANEENEMRRESLHDGDFTVMASNAIRKAASKSE